MTIAGLPSRTSRCSRRGPGVATGVDETGRAARPPMPRRWAERWTAEQQQFGFVGHGPLQREAARPRRSSSRATAQDHPRHRQDAGALRARPAFAEAGSKALPMTSITPSRSFESPRSPDCTGRAQELRRRAQAATAAARRARGHRPGCGASVRSAWGRPSASAAAGKKVDRLAMPARRDQRRGAAADDQRRVDQRAPPRRASRLATGPSRR